MVSRKRAPWDPVPVEVAVSKADKPLVMDNTTTQVTWRSTMFAIAFLLLQFAEEGLKLVDLPKEWAILITTLAAGVVYALRQAFLMEMQKRGR